MAFSDQLYSRIKDGFRFRFKGMKTNAAPDSLPPDKYPLAINVRPVGDTTVKTRPGQLRKFTAAGNPITDIRAFSALQFDDVPIYVTRDNSDHVYVGPNSAGTLASGTPVSGGAAMVPFRPNASPNPWMYVANGSDYQKFFPLSPFTKYKVGIAEPQAAPDAVITGQFYNSGFVGAYTAAGTAGGLGTAARVTDTVQSTPLHDPASGINGPYSVPVSAATNFQKMMLLTINAITAGPIYDVFAPIPQTININSIYYYTGSTGHCWLYPANIGSSIPLDNQSVFGQNLLYTFRRGALIKFSGFAEVCYVWSSILGPDGSIAIETSTVNNHTSAETFTAIPAIQVQGNFASGNAITYTVETFTIGAGIGTVTSPPTVQPFINAGVAFKNEDYISLGLKVDNLANLIEIKFLIDVGDGSFTQNFYYYSIRPSDINTAAIANTTTQLASVQTLEQSALIDAEKAQAHGNQLTSASSAQTVPGVSQWTQIVFPISALTRVGSDASKSLANVIKSQILVNASGALNMAFDGGAVIGGFQADVGSDNTPFTYRIRPRSSVTGVKGNPSPATRYGINPRRFQVEVSLPVSAYDPQFDTWDIFRMGGTVESYRYIGSATVGTAFFLDNYDDDAAGAGEALDFDNYEPWPSVDVPFNSTCNVTGPIATITAPSSSFFGSYLPGTLVRIGGNNVYTLRNRPVNTSSSNWRLEFEENATFGSNLPIQIQEPSVANQKLPYMWGPDATGTVFAVGDPLRPGTLYFSKPNDPDAAPEKYNLEIVQPSEPLIGGKVVDGLSFVASTERWWALYPQFGNELQRYNIVQQEVPRGLAAPYGVCTDNQQIFFWAKDGIWSTLRGSLTDEDLYNIFPHDGVAPQPYSYGGYNIIPPDYSQAARFRLAYVNHYLYATYVGLDGNNYTLVRDNRRGGWSLDSYNPQVTVVYHPEQQAGTLVSTLPAVYDELVFGNKTGVVSSQSYHTNDLGGTIPAVLATFEFDGGDVRTSEQWGDIWLDCVPAAPNLTITPMFNGSAAFAAQAIPQATTRTFQSVSVGGAQTLNFMGVMAQWTDNFSVQTVGTDLFVWQPSYLEKPPTISTQDSDWYDTGNNHNKWFQGFILHADTSNAAKGLTIRDADTLSTHAFTPAVVHNGESELAYSFNTPFIAHMVRFEPDAVPWRFFDITWVTEPTPEFAETWQTQGTSFGLLGYMHVKQVSPAYASTVPITLTITSFDGLSPAVITLPSTGGAFQKSTFMLTPNKGQLYFFRTSASSPYQLYLPDWEVLVGQWGRSESYIRWQGLGGLKGDNAKI
jgi:hypothetical protein